MTSTIAPVGSANFNISISEESEALIEKYYEAVNLKSKIGSAKHLHDTKKILAKAKALKQFKEENKKAPHINRLGKIDKALESLISELSDLKGVSLATLQNEIRQETAQIGYNNLEPFTQPENYANEVLIPFRDKVVDSKNLLSSAKPLKKQAWKLFLAQELALSHKLLTGSAPSLFAPGSNAEKPAFNCYIEDLVRMEFRSGISERPIREAIQLISKSS